jgi:hypothetical protein
MLTDQQASLDRFAEPYFVSEEVARDWVRQDASDRFDLVRVKLNPRGRDRRHPLVGPQAREIGLDEVVTAVMKSAALDPPVSEEVGGVSESLTPSDDDRCIANEALVASDPN